VLALAGTSLEPESFALKAVAFEAIIEPHALKLSAAVITPRDRKVRVFIMVSSF
jgi:hypothetical protein